MPKLTQVHSRMTASRRRSSKLRNGITLNYAVQVDPKGPVIVMLHGGGDCWHSSARVLLLVPSRYRVYAVTLRGHGLSDHPASGHSRADFADDILDLLDQLQIQHAILVGHSLGSFVAQKVAERDKGHLDRLMLIAPAQEPAQCLSRDRDTLCIGSVPGSSRLIWWLSCSQARR